MLRFLDWRAEQSSLLGCGCGSSGLVQQ